MKNMGSIDKIFRILFAVVAGVLIFTGVFSGGTAWVFGLLALIFLLTSLVGFCPIYKIFKISSN